MELMDGVHILSETTKYTSNIFVFGIGIILGILALCALIGIIIKIIDGDFSSIFALIIMTVL